MSDILRALWRLVHEHPRPAVQLAASAGLTHSAMSRALSAGTPGGESTHDPRLSTVERIAAAVGLRVGLLSGSPDPLAAALSDAVAALRRAEDAAVAAGDERTAWFVRPALRGVERLAGASPTAPALRPEDAVVSLVLTRRASGILLAAGITQIRDLTARTRLDLRKLRGFGLGCLREVKEALAAHGLRLAGDAS